MRASSDALIRYSFSTPPRLCIRPRGDQELVSFTIHVPPWLRKDKEDVERKLVWQGDSSEILEEGPLSLPFLFLTSLRLLTLPVSIVEVGDWLPTYRVLPMGLPVVWNTLFLYLKMLSLSLYFFNLLPLPFLDGGQLFDVLYDWRTSARRDPTDGETLILDQLEAAPPGAERVSPHTRSPGATRRKLWWRRAVHISVGMLTGCCVFLSFMKTL
uniref:N/A n=1 Tax=Ganoderma boninense TaxID=34458 RepID=A0A5K1K9D2_9APHY|nr:N/A [Ganoderma boninense]